MKKAIELTNVKFGYNLDQLILKILFLDQVEMVEILRKTGVMEMTVVQIIIL